MSKRLDEHYTLSADLSLLSDASLRRLNRNIQFKQGWGLTGELALQGRKVFVKRLPVTALEMSHRFSTKNVYQLPTWYNYGVGSAGFGSFRELAAHHRTTHWVRRGETGAFPLLHHCRLLPVETSHQPIPDLERYVAYWNGSKRVARYVNARAEAEYELVLYLEYLTPFPDWIAKNPGKLNVMFNKAIRAADVMSGHGMIHFDAHADNWLTDGNELMLGDLGLVLDQSFELSPTEQKFFVGHRHYDYAQIIHTMGASTRINYFGLKDAEKEKVHQALGLTPAQGDVFLAALTREAIALDEQGIIKLRSVQRRFLKKYASIIGIKDEFFSSLRSGHKRSDLYPARKLARRLKQLGKL